MSLFHLTREPANAARVAYIDEKHELRTEFELAIMKVFSGDILFPAKFNLNLIDRKSFRET